MRVLLHQGRVPVQLSMMTPGAFIATTALIASGSLACLPDGSICEPVEVFDQEPDAHTHRAQLAAKHPGEDFRVIMNADISI
jgi:hypothetical protein